MPGVVTRHHHPLGTATACSRRFRIGCPRTLRRTTRPSTCWLPIRPLRCRRPTNWTKPLCRYSLDSARRWTSTNGKTFRAAFASSNNALVGQCRARRCQTPLHPDGLNSTSGSGRAHRRRVGASSDNRAAPECGEHAHRTPSAWRSLKARSSTTGSPVGGGSSRCTASASRLPSTTSARTVPRCPTSALRRPPGLTRARRFRATIAGAGPRATGAPPFACGNPAQLDLPRPQPRVARQFSQLIGPGMTSRRIAPPAPSHGRRSFRFCCPTPSLDEQGRAR